MSHWYNWLEVQARIDTINLYVFFIAATGLIWYKLWLYKFAKSTAAAGLIMFGLFVLGDLWR